MIFWTITGSFASAVVYDKWQTKKMREKWCSLVSHIADERLDTKTMPRKVTIYLQAPPGDGLRSAREHFYTYVKPVLVAAAMDWDVIEGRKEGDVRHKTAEKIRKRRKWNGEGEGTSEDEVDGEAAVQALRQQIGNTDYPGVAGDIVIGRHTWKEYVRGIHEGYLGPPDAPKEHESENASEQTTTNTLPSDEGSKKKDVVDAPIQASNEAVSSLDLVVGDAPMADQASTNAAADGNASEGDKTADAEKTKDEAEKPKRRFPAPYILPENYESATLSPSTPEIIGPSIGVRLPHLLGFRNTPIRFYRFLTRRRLMDDVGRQVASAVLASYRPYGSVSIPDENSASGGLVDVPEQKMVLEHEEKDWWKTVRQPRKEHEESVWIEAITLDQRIAERMRVFELTAEEASRAQRIEAGTERPRQPDEGTLTGM
jgi:import inner membrane translocase subunit TIM54